jgi:quercetin dioxygenase-like cupin family protein
MNGHVGFVLRGEMKIDFNGKILSYKAGDGIWINQGVDSKHKVIIEKDKFVELILFEEN